MAASAYIQGAADQEFYGIPLATPVDIMRASSLIDHYLRRPKGCVWVADQTGQPIYMFGANPTITYTTAGTISPGASVVVTLPAFVGQDDSLVGDVLILDRLIPSVAEACVVATCASGQVTLKNVQFTHNGATTPVTLDRGLVIDEEHPLPGQRSITRLAEWPIANVLGALGRYSYGRRSDQKLGYFYDVNLLSTLSAFGGPPTWNAFSIPSSSLNPSTGDLWVPAGLLLAYYTDIKARYVGGWPQTSLPTEIKLATAALVKSIHNAPMGPLVRRFNTGKISIERFSDTVIDEDIKGLLRPYQANWFV